MAAPLSKDARQIAGMFDAIAPRYDLLNQWLSAGFDRRWRRRAVRSLALTGRETLLDLCTGTADVALAARRTAGGARRVVGVDFAAAMLEVAREKIDQAGERASIALLRGDATRLPIEGASVDALSVAFGVRNVDDAVAACREMCRVLRPGGRLAILEFAIPKLAAVRGAYLFYFTRVLPRLGKLVSHHSTAYAYLPASVGAFQTPDEFARLLRDVGFVDVSATRLTFGIVYLYTATN
ncbi:MAG: bifunctional demethylmenaquinone methyltransferase/2-methoxy-6-polyprenyl-1,4-benzoquinol methylase UbiE [Acidobacteria bacterium]|nr:MAG: bifunctional demethylmenaquinone methyltransferase/2-methoxy-6-polyprenyl-1,4-benzoquinol methylase UbiE [Acidobacteriota bacterium]